MIFVSISKQTSHIQDFQSHLVILATLISPNKSLYCEIVRVVGVDNHRDSKDSRMG